MTKAFKLGLTKGEIFLSSIAVLTCASAAATYYAEREQEELQTSTKIIVGMASGVAVVTSLVFAYDHILPQSFHNRFVDIFINDLDDVAQNYSDSISGCCRAIYNPASELLSYCYNSIWNLFSAPNIHHQIHEHV